MKSRFILIRGQAKLPILSIFSFSTLNTPAEIADNSTMALIPKALHHWIPGFEWWRRTPLPGRGASLISFGSLLILFIMNCVSLSAQAQNIDAGITYQGRILKPDNSPLTSDRVNFDFQFVVSRTEDPEIQCVLYSEKIEGVDLSSNSGMFSVVIGRGVRTDQGASVPFAKIFAPNLIYPDVPNQCIGGYHRKANDRILLRVSFNDGSGRQSLAPIEVTATPFAIETLKVAGVDSARVLRVSPESSSQEAPSLINPVPPLAQESFQELLRLLEGTSSQYLPSNGVTGLSSGTISARPPAGTLGRLYVATDSNEIYRDDGVSWVPVNGAVKNFIPIDCTSGQTMIYNPVSDRMICTAVSLVPTIPVTVEKPTSSEGVFNVSNPTSGSKVQTDWLDVGVDGFARFVLLDDDRKELKYVRCLDKNCLSKNTQTLVADAVTKNNPSMILGPDDLARIIYFKNSTPKQIMYLRCLDTDCSSKEEVAIASPTLPSIGGPVMALDSQGFVQAAYIDFNYSGGFIANHVVHVRCLDHACSNPSVKTLKSGSNGAYPKLAIDASNIPSIAYYTVTPSSMPTGYGLKYLRCADVACSEANEATLFSTEVYPYFDIEFGPDGLPRIAFARYSSTSLEFLTCVNTQCSTFSTRVLDPVAGNTGYIYMMMDNNGFARILYGAAGERYLQCTNADCSSSSNAILPTSVSSYGFSLNTSGVPIVLSTSGSSTAPSITAIHMGSSSGELTATGQNVGSTNAPYANA